MERHFASPPEPNEAREHFQKALSEARQAREQAEKAFPHPIDPAGGEVGIVRTHSARLVQAIGVMLGNTQS
jgi:hypothetical protein